METTLKLVSGLRTLATKGSALAYYMLVLCKLDEVRVMLDINVPILMNVLLELTYVIKMPFVLIISAVMNVTASRVSQDLVRLLAVGPLVVVLLVVPIFWQMDALTMMNVSKAHILVLKTGKDSNFDFSLIKTLEIRVDQAFVTIPWAVITANVKKVMKVMDYWTVI